jgi:cyclophilin family peptidyl-prolyl cis-trans isomerase
MSGARRGRDEKPATEQDPNSPRSIGTALLTVGGTMAATLLVVLFFLSGAFEQLITPPATEPPPTFTPIAGLTPPAVTPIPSGEVPDEPAGDGTRATIVTEVGDIVIELYNLSSPVAAQNFINLAQAGFYEGIIFHRVIPGFVIQGGDPTGTGTGGPGFTIQDEPVVGEYVRGTVAMARRPQVANSQSSQFFVVLEDSVRDRLPTSDGYAIFGNVIEGMDVVDEIAAGETGDGDRPVDPVQIIEVIIDDTR